MQPNRHRIGVERATLRADGRSTQDHRSDAGGFARSFLGGSSRRGSCENGNRTYGFGSGRGGSRLNADPPRSVRLRTLLATVNDESVPAYAPRRRLPIVPPFYGAKYLSRPRSMNSFTTALLFLPVLSLSATTYWPRATIHAHIPISHPSIHDFEILSAHRRTYDPPAYPT